MISSVCSLLAHLIHSSAWPDLREHAIFALRNLLHGNAANQAVVEAIQPLQNVGTWDENGVLQNK